MSEKIPQPQPPADGIEDETDSLDASQLGAAGDLSPPPAPPEVALRGRLATPAALFGQLHGELPNLSRVSEPEVQLLASGWLAGFRSPRTRRAYAGDLAAFNRWCGERDLHVLRAGRVQLDLYLAHLLAQPQAPSSVSRRISALSSFFDFAASHGLGTRPAGSNPTIGVRRPRTNAHTSMTLGLNREQARALILAVDSDPGSQRLRSRVLVRLLLHSALRVDEVIGANHADVGRRPGRTGTHVTLAVTRKGGRRSVIALAPSTAAALRRYLTTTATAASTARSDPLLPTRTGGRMTQKAVWTLVRRTARRAGIADWSRLSPHSLRHTSITLALDAGAPLRDVQDFAGHQDARTTRRYDRSRESLDRSPTYAVARWLEDD